jgi:hypothetical protein
MDRFGLIFFVLRTAMSQLERQCVENNLLEGEAIQLTGKAGEGPKLLKN